MALRGWDGALADAEDRAERVRTRFVLRQGAVRLGWAVLAQAFSRPAAFFSALRLATRSSRGSDRPLAYHWIYLAEACLVARWLKERAIGHVHAHFGTNSAEVAMLAGVLGGARYSMTVHGPDEFDRPAAIGLASKIRRAAFTVGISSYTRSQLYRWVERAEWARIHVVHCGIDASSFETAPALDDVARFVCVGRLSEQKGQFLLLDAVRRLADRGTAVELVLAGDGELRAGLETRIQTLGLEKQVRITGWIDGAQVRAEILAARALVLPSFAEGLPVVIMEAMALRRPVITTWIAGTPELVRSGETGWLIPAGDVDALADAMARCLGASVESLRRMGDLARERVLARHDVEAEAAKLAVLFRGEAVHAP